MPPTFITTQNSLGFPNENPTILETTATALGTLLFVSERHHVTESLLTDGVTATDGSEFTSKILLFPFENRCWSIMKPPPDDYRLPFY